MCLMHTDLPVPEGPRIIEICPSGRPRLRPFRIVLRPNDFLTSMNSTVLRAVLARPARVPLVGVLAVAGLGADVVRHPLVGDARRRGGGRRGRLPLRWLLVRLLLSLPARLLLSRIERLPALVLPLSLMSSRVGTLSGLVGWSPRRSVPTIPTRCTSTVFSTIDFAVAVPTPTGPPVVAVVAPGTITVAIAMPLIRLYMRSGGVPDIQKMKVAAGPHLPDLLDDCQVGGEVAGAHRRDVHERQHHPGGQQARGAQEDEGELMPITSSASISSEIRIAPISATRPVPTFADIM